MCKISFNFFYLLSLIVSYTHKVKFMNINIISGWFKSCWSQSKRREATILSPSRVDRWRVNPAFTGGGCFMP